MSAPGKGPFLRNVSTMEVDTFRQQVQVVDLIGCQDVDKIGPVDGITTNTHAGTHTHIQLFESVEHFIG